MGGAIVAIQFPASRPVQSSMDIANRHVDASQRQQHNALVNDANRMQNQQTQGRFDDDKRLKTARMFKVVSERGMKMLEEDPNSYSRWMPDMVEKFREAGLPIEKLPPADSTGETVMEGLRNMSNIADDIMAELGQGQMQDITAENTPYAQRDPNSGAVGIVGSSGGNSTAQIRNEEYRARKIAEGSWTQNDQDRFDASVRAPQYGDIAGVPSRFTGGNDPVPLSTQGAELDFAKREAQAREQGSRAGQPTTAQEKIDQAYAPEYVAFTQGGYQDAMKGIEQLTAVQAQLNNPSADLSGWQVASQPDIMLSVTNPEALQAREQVEEVVQRNLRLILGAQFTEKEGVRLIARAYNPWMDEKYNAIRINRLVKSITEAADAKVAAAKHYEEFGTLKNFESKVNYVITDFYDVLDDQSQLTIGDTYKGRKYLGGNPKERSSWE